MKFVMFMGNTGLSVSRRASGDEDILGVTDNTPLELVSDEDWVIQENYADADMYNGVNVYRVTALPSTETGQYELRYLLIKPQLIAEMLAMESEELWFEMEDACLRIPASVFNSDAARAAVESCGFGMDEFIFVMMIKPDSEGQEVEEGGKAYTVGLFVRDGDLLGNAAPDLFDVTQELGSPMRLMAREEAPAVAFVPQPDLI